MEIYISIDGVLRNTIAKFDYHYKDHYLDSDPEDLPEDEKGYKYDIIEPVRNNHLMESYKFQSKDEFENFTLLTTQLKYLVTQLLHTQKRSLI